MNGPDIIAWVFVAIGIAMLWAMVADAKKDARRVQPVTVTITADTSALEAGLSRARFAIEMNKAVQTMRAFEASMRKVQETANLSSAEIERFSRSLKQLAGEPDDA